MSVLGMRKMVSERRLKKGLERDLIVYMAEWVLGKEVCFFVFACCRRLLPIARDGIGWKRGSCTEQASSIFCRCVYVLNRWVYCPCKVVE